MKFHYAATTKDSDMFYLVGGLIPDPFFYIDTGETKTIFLDVREIGQYNEHHDHDDVKALPLEPYIAEAMKLSDDAPLDCRIALLLMQEYGKTNVPIELSTHFPLHIAEYLRGKGIVLAVAEPFLPERVHKTSTEVAYIRDNMHITCLAFEHVEQILRAAHIENDALIYEGTALTSEYLKKQITVFLAEHDMSIPESIIISCGLHASMPHHHGMGFIHPNETIICDFFPRSNVNGYFADMTRTYVKGTPSAQAQEMYDAVFAAQEAAFKEIRPGALSGAAYQAASRMFIDAGFDVGEKGFLHGLGHGFGIDIHERPYANARTREILEVGHILTVEPGLYYPEWGGVRLEDVIVVTENGFENLTNYPREFLIV